jgi:tRNA (guanine26-N2/guanine27-N2)-dimethyltransferase
VIGKNAKLDSIIEGKTNLVVPESANQNGPAKKASIFYNPAMRTNRDITVLFGRAAAKKGWAYLDALGGTGAKGIRLAVESGIDLEIMVNDFSPMAFETINKNIAANHLKNVESSCMEYNALLSERSFDWIDIDPYGSPVKFIDMAVQRLARNGVLSITATDTAPLCGAKPEVCIRRYMAQPMRCGCVHEIGLRILVGNTVRKAAALDVGLVPMLSYYYGHYFRAYFKMKKSAGAANSGLRNLGYVAWEKNSGYSVQDTQPAKGQYAGPLWTGDLWEPELVARMLSGCDDAMSRETISTIRKIDEELLQPPFNYHMDELASMTGSDPMKTKDMVRILGERGYKSSMVHYNQKSFKTDAGLPALREIFNTASH